MLLIFNDIASSEILLILAFILIFFGSKSIPGLARTLGRTIRQVKEASSDIQHEIKKTTSEIKGELNLKSIISETAEDIKRPLDQYAQDLDHAMKYQPPKRNVNQSPLDSDDVKKEIETEVKGDLEARANVEKEIYKEKVSGPIAEVKQEVELKKTLADNKNSTKETDECAD